MTPAPIMCNMKRRILSIISSEFLLIMSINLPAIAQESPVDTLKIDERYVDSLRVWRSFFSGTKYSYRGKEGRVGSGGPVKDIVNDIPPALHEVEIFEKYNNTSTGLGVLSAFAYVYALNIKILGRGVFGGNDKTANILLLSGLGVSLGSLFVDLLGYDHLKEGVFLFNVSRTSEKDGEEK